jgi:Protein of unknown function (DUF2934)
MQDEHQAIAELAYRLWESRGRPEGEHDQIWLDAESQIKRDSGGHANSTPATVIDNTLKDTFPASDPPSSQLPDSPPSNAAEKWRSAGIQPGSGKPTARR